MLKVTMQASGKPDKDKKSKRNKKSWRFSKRS